MSEPTIYHWVPGFSKQQEVFLKQKGGKWLEVEVMMKQLKQVSLGGGFKYFLFSPLHGEMIQFD